MNARNAALIRHAIEQARKPANPALYESLRNGLTRRSWRLWVRAHNRITMRRRFGLQAGDKFFCNEGCDVFGHFVTRIERDSVGRKLYFNTMHGESFMYEHHVTRAR